MDPNPDTAPSQPVVLITKESQNIKPPKNWKPIILIGIILIVGALTLAGVSYHKQIQNNLTSLSYKIGIDKILTSLKIEPQVATRIASQGRLSDLTIKGHPTLYYADLEYDPKTAITTQFGTGITYGDPPYLQPNQPSTQSPNKFIFKIEISDESGKISEAGWKETYREIIQTPTGKLRFRITATYRKKSFIKVYLADKKLIWTGKMPDQI